MNMAAKPHRAVCYRCDKSQKTCICHLCEVVDNQTEILILQHARERRHALGTTRIALLTLARIQRINTFNTLERQDLSPNCALLYPGPDATLVDDLEPQDKPDQLIVLDGTWPQALVLYRSNAWLRELPQISLEPKEPSNYRIRTEPALNCISTIESIIQALRVLEPQTPNLDNPLMVFRKMIDQQISLIDENVS